MIVSYRSFINLTKSFGLTGRHLCTKLQGPKQHLVLLLEIRKTEFESYFGRRREKPFVKCGNEFFGFCAAFEALQKLFFGCCFIHYIKHCVF